MSDLQKPQSDTGQNQPDDKPLDDEKAPPKEGEKQGKRG